MSKVMKAHGKNAANSHQQEVVITIDSSVLKLVSLIIVGVVALVLGFAYINVGRSAPYGENRAGGDAGREQSKVPSYIGASPVLGESGAPVTVFEYSDFECPFCARHALQTFPLLKREYIDTGKIRYVFKNFIAVPSHEPSAKLAAYAAYCVYKLGGNEAFWDYKQKLFKAMSEGAEGIPASAEERQKQLNKFKEGLIKLASTVEVQAGQVKECLDNPEEVKKVFSEDQKYVMEQIAPRVQRGVGTPLFVVCRTPKTADAECEGEVILGAYPFSEFERVINNILNK